MSNVLDQVILVTSDDQPIGTMDKVEAHRGQAKLHRAISVFLFNDRSELLIQQRSAHKIVGALQWANTCCGNLRPGESYEDCAYRRLREELGITDVKLTSIHKFEYHTQCNDEFSEWEMDQVYVGKYEGNFEINGLEVKNAKFENIEKLLISIEENVENYTPWFALMLRNTNLAKSLYQENYVRN